jgi:hypothetical protein
LSERKRKRNDPQYVTREECQRISGEIRNDLHTIKKALIGEDMQSGLVKTVHDLAKNQSLTKELIKSVGVPILVVLITAWILTGMPH